MKLDNKEVLAIFDKCYGYHFQQPHQISTILSVAASIQNGYSVKLMRDLCDPLSSNENQLIAKSLLKSVLDERDQLRAALIVAVDAMQVAFAPNGADYMILDEALTRCKKVL